MAVSKLARNPIEIPSNVSFIVSPCGKNCSVTSSLGVKKVMEIPGCVSISVEGTKCIVASSIARNSPYIKALVGTCAAKLRRLVLEAQNPCKLTLVMEGVGFKSFLVDSNFGANTVLVCNTRKSLLDAIVIPLSVKVTVRDRVFIDLVGFAEDIGIFADDIMRFRKWDACRQNGIFREGTVLRKKEGKKK